MKIIDFKEIHAESARAIAYDNYLEERESVGELPFMESVPQPDIFAENGLGVAAFEGDTMIGFLGCYAPREHAFGSNASGVFSPIHGHGAVMENRGMIYKRMYQAAAEKWVSRKIMYHSIALYAHDQPLLNTFFRYGFGLRCVDAVRPLAEIGGCQTADFRVKELERSEIPQIRNLRKMLLAHLGDSPCFMDSRQQESESWLLQTEKRNSVIYTALKNQEVIAFLEITDGGENFITDSKNMKNICGAFCLPQYRGLGVLQCLIDHAIVRLREEGAAYLGVDFESFNPTADAFWNKYFTAYTHGVVRRIDECAGTFCGRQIRDGVL